MIHQRKSKHRTTAGFESPKAESSNQIEMGGEQT